MNISRHKRHDNHTDDYIWERQLDEQDNDTSHADALHEDLIAFVNILESVVIAWMMDHDAASVLAAVGVG